LITEWFENEKVCCLDTDCKVSPIHSVQKRIIIPTIPQYPSTFDVEIDINAKTLTGKVDTNSDSVPQIVFDYMAEIEKLTAAPQIAAINRPLMDMVALHGWYGHFGTISLLKLVNEVATILSDVDTIIMTAATHLLCKGLCRLYYS